MKSQGEHKVLNYNYYVRLHSYDSKKIQFNEYIFYNLFNFVLFALVWRYESCMELEL